MSNCHSNLSGCSNADDVPEKGETSVEQNRTPGGQETRRQVFRTGAASAALAAVGLTAWTSSASGQPPQFPKEAQDEKDAASSAEDRTPASADRKAVLKAGMTEQEADCWELIAKAAGAFFELPELHPMDKAEVATAIHVVQNKLLGRPTYRTYLATHKANASPPDATEDTDKSN